ncbi:MAG: D-alanine--D-alanine ligase [Epsilonproteobacteria bacterium]|nr:MAG: D-alanine--D-alanine ligase [Campylobacterota bacterium]
MELAILFGGASFEHEISIVSAITLKEKMRSYDLKFVFCDQDHRFYLIDGNHMQAKTFASGAYKKMPRLSLDISSFVQKKRFGTQTYTFTILNLIHGADGEDGTISSMLDFYKISYIGPRTAASVLSYDKRYTKWLAESLGIKAVEYEIVYKDTVHKIKMALPFIVKPSCLGSSIGVSVVRQESEIDYALDVAFEFDESVIIEPFLEGVKEYNLAGYAAGENMVYSMIEEPQKDDFLDFDKKYLDFSRSSIVSAADLDEEVVKRFEHVFERIYRNRFEGALIRCDFFMIEGEIYLNEINPIPGSMANYLFTDFESCIQELMSHLPSKQMPTVDYKYIHSIHAAKGK